MLKHPNIFVHWLATKSFISWSLQHITRSDLNCTIVTSVTDNYKNEKHFTVMILPLQTCSSEGSIGTFPRCMESEGYLAARNRILEQTCPAELRGSDASRVWCAPGSFPPCLRLPALAHSLWVLSSPFPFFFFSNGLGFGCCVWGFYMQGLVLRMLAFSVVKWTNWLQLLDFVFCSTNLIGRLVASSDFCDCYTRAHTLV